MKKRILSYLALLITCIGAIGVGVEIVMSETMYPEIDEFTSCPLYYQILMYVFLFIVLVGIVLSRVFRRKETTKKIELYVEIVLLVLGIVFMSFALDRNEAYYKDIIICVGGLLFPLGIFAGISTIIGLNCKNKDGVNENNSLIIKEKGTISKKNKSLIILSIVTIVGVIILFAGGIITDIVWWNYVYNHRDPSVPGHGVPIFSALGIVLAIAFSLIMSIIITIKAVNNNKQK